MSQHWRLASKAEEYTERLCLMYRFDSKSSSAVIIPCNKPDMMVHELTVKEGTLTDMEGFTMSAGSFTPDAKCFPFGERPTDRRTGRPIDVVILGEFGTIVRSVEKYCEAVAYDNPESCVLCDLDRCQAWQLEADSERFEPSNTADQEIFFHPCGTHGSDFVFTQTGHFRRLDDTITAMARAVVACGAETPFTTLIQCEGGEVASAIRGSVQSGECLSSKASSMLLSLGVSDSDGTRDLAWAIASESRLWLEGAASVPAIARGDGMPRIVRVPGFIEPNRPWA